MTQTIKHPILKNVSYFDISKNQQTLKSFTGKELENKTWRELQLLVGSFVGSGRFNYCFQFKNNDAIFRGTIRGVTDVPTKPETTNKNLEDEITALSNKLDKITTQSSNGIGYDVLISVTKQSYETQIVFLKEQLTQKDITISELKEKIKDLDKELDAAYDQIDELGKNAGMNQYIELAKDFLKLKIPGKVDKISLKDSDSSDIPKQLIDILGVVDWKQVDESLIDEIAKYLNVFIPKLPLKGA